MKKLFKLAVLASAMACGVASAATYTLNSNAPGATIYAGPSLSVLHGVYSAPNQEVFVTRWITPNLLVANATGNSYLAGSFVGSDNNTYTLGLTLGGTSFSGNTQLWASTTGELLRNGQHFRTITGGLMPSALGINAAPYNTGNSKLEFGMWASYGGGFHFDVNNEITCTAGKGALTGSSTGAGHGCPTTPTPPTGVPLPGTLALLGLGFLGLGLRKKSV